MKMIFQCMRLGPKQTCTFAQKGSQHNKTGSNSSSSGTLPHSTPCTAGGLISTDIMKMIFQCMRLGPAPSCTFSHMLAEVSTTQAAAAAAADCCSHHHALRDG
jgi:hypothetical protein